MLNWDFVKADPVTYRATYGAIRFEVTVGADNRETAVTVTRTEGDKFEIKAFRNHGKALRWVRKSFVATRILFWSFPFMISKAFGGRHEPAFAESSVSSIALPFQSTIFLQSTSFGPNGHMIRS